MELLGVGTDIVEVNRFGEIDDKFLERYFTDKEIEYFIERKNNKETISGNFASKEAIVKAIGEGFGNLKAKEIEVIRDQKGKPIVNILNDNYKHIKFMISISHTKEYATAFAVAYI